MAKVKYEALLKFKDLEDEGKVYDKGERYPQPTNKKVSEKRLNELLSSDNKLGKPVIKEV
ncbi:hypothetical protein P5663_06990 [Priestia flexa]|uniref:hypothetical protein n=1 Tax=Priestia flexa TaxID=86664 RepID=UPI00240DF919|nr:hypothetical protein [Priestia flexa]WEZ09581.1 hypothetical protein P5663_06990 [Priestia flexa]